VRWTGRWRNRGTGPAEDLEGVVHAEFDSNIPMEGQPDAVTGLRDPAQSSMDPLPPSRAQMIETAQILMKAREKGRFDIIFETHH
jgi:hypothetical protein